MKKTLLFTTLFSACVMLSARATEPEIKVNWGSGAYISGDLVIDSGNASSYINSGTFTNGGGLNISAGVNVGCCLGDGSMTVMDASVSTPNNLYIGGAGYWDPNIEKEDWYSSTYHDGTVTVKAGGTLTVGVSNVNYPGTQLNIANVNQAATGSLIVEAGGTVHANVLTMIGGGAGTGVLKVSGENASIDFSKQGVVNYNYLSLYAADGGASKAEITVENHASFTCSDDTVTSYVCFGCGGEATIQVTGESEMILPTAGKGMAVMGYASGSQTTLEVDNSRLVAGTFYTGYASNTDSSISLTNGAEMTATTFILGVSANTSNDLSIDESSSLSGGDVYVGNNSGSGILTNAGNVETENLFICNSASGIINTGTVSATVAQNYGTLVTEKLHIGEGKLDGAFNAESFTNAYVVAAGAVELTDSASFTNNGSEYASLYADKTIVSDNAQLAVDILCIGGTGVTGAYNTEILVNKVCVDAEGTAQAGVVATEKFTIENGSVYNYGLMDAQSDITLGDGGYLLTGTLTVEGRENAVNDGSPATLAYTTGLTDGTSVSVNGENVAVGAKVISATASNQYVTGADLTHIDAKVLEGFGLAESSGVKVVNEFDSTVQAALTTAEVNDNVNSVIVAVNGANVVIDKSSKQGVPTNGTIGSYSVTPTETQASIRVTEANVSPNQITWNGDALKTMAGEITLFNSGTTLVTDSGNDASKLVVVENSTLNNQGTVNSAVEVNGTLKGTGTISGMTTIKNGGTFVVGNSPGYTVQSGGLTIEEGGEIVFSVAGLTTPASEGVSGWSNAVYSQINLGGKDLTISSTANIVIEFGGSWLFTHNVGEPQDFALSLVADIGASSLDATALLTHTTWKLAEEGNRPADAQIKSVSFTAYEMSGNTLILKGVLTAVPEPSMFGLLAGIGALALAGTRRRRRR